MDEFLCSGSQAESLNSYLIIFLMSAHNQCPAIFLFVLARSSDFLLTMPLSLSPYLLFGKDSTEIALFDILQSDI